MTIKDLLDIVNLHYMELGKRMDSLKNNEINHLEQKVDKLTWLMGVGVGILIALQFVIKFML